MTLKILVCGGGNGAHVMAGLAASKQDVECRVLRLHNDAEKWRKAVDSEPMSLLITDESGKDYTLQAKPDKISNNPADVVPGADAIILTVPAFSHKTYFSAIQPHITSPTIIFGLPCQPGFEFESQFILKDKLSMVTLISVEILPWACRIMEYGKKVRVQGVKNTVKVATIIQNDKSHKNPIDLLQTAMGPETKLTPTTHALEFSLMFAVVHPGLMYGKWKDWDGQPVSEEPLFYQGADDVQTKYVTDLEDEILLTAKEISRQKPNINLSGCMPMFERLITFYGSAVTDTSSFKMALISNKAYDGLVHPMKSVEGGYVPDFKYRYLSEDIPFGLVVTKGLAELAGVPTPVADEVILWGQQKLEKEYIVGTKLTGKDMNETRAPQAYGINSLDELDKWFA